MLFPRRCSIRKWGTIIHRKEKTIGAAYHPVIGNGYTHDRRHLCNTHKPGCPFRSMTVAKPRLLISCCRYSLLAFNIHVTISFIYAAGMSKHISPYAAGWENMESCLSWKYERKSRIYPDPFDYLVHPLQCIQRTVFCLKVIDVRLHGKRRATDTFDDLGRGELASVTIDVLLASRAGYRICPVSFHRGWMDVP